MVAATLPPSVVVDVTDPSPVRVPIDGTELVETFFAVKQATGLRTWDATATKAFRAVFVRMLEQARTA